MSDKPRKSPSGDYDVGFCRPPKSGQFKPGQSGNPKGARKRNGTLHGALKAELERTHTVREKGRKRVLTTAEIMARQWVRLGMEGKANALAQIAKLEPQFMAQLLSNAFPMSGELNGSVDALTETDVEMMKWYVKGQAADTASDAREDSEDEGESP